LEFKSSHPYSASVADHNPVIKPGDSKLKDTKPEIQLLAATKTSNPKTTNLQPGKSK